MRKRDRCFPFSGELRQIVYENHIVRENDNLPNACLHGKSLRYLCTPAVIQR